MTPDFFSSAREAESLGRLFDARQSICTRASEPLSIEALAREAGMSSFHFLRLFRHLFRETPHQLLIGMRLERAKTLLRETDLAITEICFECGYESLGSFSALFRREVGCSPREYRTQRWFWPVNISFPRAMVPFCLFDGFRRAG